MFVPTKTIIDMNIKVEHQDYNPFYPDSFDEWEIIKATPQRLKEDKTLRSFLENLVEFKKRMERRVLASI